MKQLDIFGTSEELKPQQGSIDKFFDFDGFTEKFKPKKTTDDCYTPPAIYDALLDYISGHVLSLDGLRVVRPFWPGADYKAQQYGPDDVVIDNPPFSIITQIVRYYVAAGVRFWLFAPHLTLFASLRYGGVSAVVADADVTYENGAKVNTSFLTNLLPPDVLVKVDGTLHDILVEADRQSRAVKTKQVTKYRWPDEVTSSALIGSVANAGIDMEIRRQEAVCISRLDLHAGGIFGSGLLLSRQAAARQATEIRLSEREQAIVESMSKE